MPGVRRGSRLLRVSSEPLHAARPPRSPPRSLGNAQHRAQVLIAAVKDCFLKGRGINYSAGAARKRRGA